MYNLYMSDVVYKLNKYSTRIKNAENLSDLSRYLKKMVEWNNHVRKQYGGNQGEFENVMNNFKGQYEETLKKIREKIGTSTNESDEKVKKIIETLNGINLANMEHGKAFIEMSELINQKNSEVQKEVGKITSGASVNVDGIEKSVDYVKNQIEVIKDPVTMVIYALADHSNLAYDDSNGVSNLEKIVSTLNLWVSGFKDNKQESITKVADVFGQIAKNNLNMFESIIYYRQVFGDDTSRKEIEREKYKNKLDEIISLFGYSFEKKNVHELIKKYYVQNISDDKVAKDVKDSERLNKNLDNTRNISDKEKYYNTLLYWILYNAVMIRKNNLDDNTETTYNEVLNVIASKAEKDITSSQKGGRPKRIIKLNVRP